MRPVRHGLRTYSRLTLLSLINVATTTSTTIDPLYDLGYRPMGDDADGLLSYNASYHVPCMQSECTTFGTAVAIPKVLPNTDRFVVNA